MTDNKMNPIRDNVFIARLTAVVDPSRHNTDDLLDFLTYPDVTWSGRYGEEFVLWGNPNFHPAGDEYFGVAEYTVRYASEADMLADAATRTTWLTKAPDAVFEWKTASVMEPTSKGKSDLFKEQADAYHDDNIAPKLWATAGNA